MIVYNATHIIISARGGLPAGVPRPGRRPLLGRPRASIYCSIYVCIDMYTYM